LIYEQRLRVGLAIRKLQVAAGQEARYRRMNHLEQLVTEWLQFNGYFVRTSVLVGRRDQGGFEGELDVIGFHPAKNHFIHVECSLDALSDEKRQVRFKEKFDRGLRFRDAIFEGLALPQELEQVAVLQVTRVKERKVGGVRAVTVRDLIHEISDRLASMPPLRNAVPSNFPLLRTLQLAADASGAPRGTQRLLLERPQSSAASI
jgi:hypothetical protein